MPTRYIGDGYWEIISRQMSVVTRSEQQRFKDSKITVIGCGGIGGETIEMLARMGIGELVLVDEDAFDLSNLNRQTLASLADVGLDKSAVAKEKVRLINPYVKVTSYNEHVDSSNIDKLIGDSDIVIDALDNVLTRVIVSRKAKERESHTFMEPFMVHWVRLLYFWLKTIRHMKRCLIFRHRVRN